MPEHVTLTARRHGGMTELGDAEVTEQRVMALSGHRTPEAARLYIKRTEAQRIIAARRRRAWVEEERKGDKIQNARANADSELTPVTVQVFEIMVGVEGLEPSTR